MKIKSQNKKKKILKEDLEKDEHYEYECEHPDFPKWRKNE